MRATGNVLYFLISCISLFLDVSIGMSPAAKAQIVPPPNTAAAEAAGYSAGYGPGSREGAERGAADGDRNGRDAGYRAGFQACENNERARYYEIGYREGYVNGEFEGERNGQLRGITDGNAVGARDGEADGIKRSDSDAYRVATPLGRKKGEEEADQSDAAKKGYDDGLVAGDREAREQAREVDYPRGRRDDRSRRYAEPIAGDDAFSQRGAGTTKLIFTSDEEDEKDAPEPYRDVRRQATTSLTKYGAKKSEWALLGSTASVAGVQSVGPDYRYRVIVVRYRYPEENQAYAAGYNRGYAAAFYATYKQYYDSSYQYGYKSAYPNGCQAGKNQNFRYDYDRGYAAGARDGYSRGYDRMYAIAYQQAYSQSFGSASAQAYQRNYPVAYDRHFENARSAAYASRYREIYNAEYTRAKRAKFAEVYPRYADQEYARGIQDEERDFSERPVRLLSAEITETVINGLYEPGETLRVRVALRNFSNAAIAASDVRVQVAALDASSAVVSVPQEALVRDLRAKSRTTVSDALEFKLTEAAANHAVKFRVSVLYAGQSGGDEVVQITGKFAATFEFAESPVFKEGFEQPVRVRVRNQSQAALDAGVALAFRSDPKMLEVTKADVLVDKLGAGEEKIVEFAAIARTSGASARFPFAISATLKDGRRVGLFEETREVPVLNDYKIELRADPSGLRGAGVFRAQYVIYNVSSRFSQKSLQLVARVNGLQQGVFEVVGPNPQYLRPVARGRSLEFTVPVLVKSANAGGTVELEVKESGQTVVIHKVSF